MSSKNQHASSRSPTIALVGSSGGHLAQLLSLREFWGDYNRFWVTFQKQDAISALQGEQVYWCHYPTNRNLPNLFRNTLLAWSILRKERPDMIISTGAAVSIPFFYFGRLLGAKTIFVEVYDRISRPTVTGKMVYPVASHFLIQWESQRRFYPKARYVGELM